MEPLFRLRGDGGGFEKSYFQLYTEQSIQFITDCSIQLATECPIQLGSDCPIQLASDCPIQLASDCSMILQHDGKTQEDPTCTIAIFICCTLATC